MKNNLKFVMIEQMKKKGSFSFVLKCVLFSALFMVLTNVIITVTTSKHLVDSSYHSRSSKDDS